jgi:hypothetical protein
MSKTKSEGDINMNEEIKAANKIAENIASILTSDNLQKYILGTKKSGQPRALYDIIKDLGISVKKKKKKDKKKKHKKGKGDSFSLFVNPSGGKKKKKKKHKHWHI